MEDFKNDLKEKGYVFIKDFYSSCEALERYSLIRDYWVKEFGNPTFKYHKSGALLDESLQHFIWHSKLLETIRLFDNDIVWGGGCKIATSPIKTIHRDDTWKDNIKDDPFVLSNNGYYRLRVVQFISEDVNEKRIFKVIPGSHKSKDSEGDVLELGITSRDIVLFHSVLKHAGGEIPEGRYLMTTTYNSSSDLGRLIYYRDAFRRFPQNMLTIDKCLNEKLLELGLSPLAENHSEFFKEQKYFMRNKGYINNTEDPML